MKKIVKAAALVSTLVLAACQTGGGSSTWNNPQAVNNSRHVENGTDDRVWKNGTDELCWQTGYYPDGDGVVGCDARPSVKPPPPTSRPTPAPTTVFTDTINLDAATLFAFDKATLSPQGQQLIGSLASALKTVQFSDAIVIGHTDSFGSPAYNSNLSLRRAEMVKAYMVNQGVPADRIVTRGMGESQLLVNPANCKGSRTARIACEQPNRRVIIDINNLVVPSKDVERWKSFVRALPGANLK